jgi:excisionase family DNA binding protein
MPKQFYTVRDIAEALSVTTTTVYRWINEGLLVPSALSPSGRARFSQTDFDSIIKKYGV